MKIKLYIKIFMLAVGAMIVSHVHAYPQKKTYIGIDAQYSTLRFKPGYGDNIFSEKPAAGLNLFIGHRFNNIFGGEFGVELDRKMHRTSNTYLGQTVCGITSDIWDPNPTVHKLYRTAVSQKHYYIGITAKFNLASNNFIELLAGMSASKFVAKYNVLLYNLYQYPDVNYYSNQKGTFSRTKVAPIIRAAIEHNFNNKLSCRVFTSWKHTSRFSTRAKERNAEQIKLKNTINLGVGVMYYVV